MTELSPEARGMMIRKLYENWVTPSDEEYVQYLSAFLLDESGAMHFTRILITLYLHCAKHDTLRALAEDIRLLIKKYAAETQGEKHDE